MKTPNPYELKPLSFQARMERLVRIGKRSMESFFNREILYGLGVAIGSVWSIGIVEAYYLTNTGQRYPKFLIKYGKENILPSIIWGQDFC